MTMNMRKTFSAAAIVAVLSCSAAHAQVLGGGLGGAVNGAIGGGLGDTSVFGNGNASGAFGGELDAGSTLRRTRDVADQSTRRARDVGTKVRNRAESSVAATHDTSANVASATASQLNAANVASATEAAASQSSALGSTADAPQDQQELNLAPTVGGASALDSTAQLDGITGNANGSASGRASASRRGVAADAAAAADASAKVHEKKQEEAQE
jgi:hypothetical protein